MNTAVDNQSNSGDEFDDALDKILDFEAEIYNTGLEKGSTVGKEKQNEASKKEGLKYGHQIGNHIGYYLSIINTLKTFKSDAFSKPNSRISLTSDKIVKLANEVNISDCYNPKFEAKMKKIRKEFKKLLSLMKIKSEEENVNKNQLEF